MLIQSAAIYQVELKSTDPGSFPVPEKYFGRVEIPADLKDLIAKPLFYASFKDKSSQVFSFFEFFVSADGETSLSRIIDLKLGKYNLIPAASNVFKPLEREVAPVELRP